MLGGGAALARFRIFEEEVAPEEEAPTPDCTGLAVILSAPRSVSAFRHLLRPVGLSAIVRITW